MHGFVRRSVALLALSLLAPACGQMGDLYRPDQVPESQMSPSQRDAARKAQAAQSTPTVNTPEAASENLAPSAQSQPSSP